jgi:hypothetical protein
MFGEKRIARDMEGNGGGLTFKLYQDIFLDGLRKIKKNLSKNIRSPN